MQELGGFLDQETPPRAPRRQLNLGKRGFKIKPKSKLGNRKKIKKTSSCKTSRRSTQTSNGIIYNMHRPQLRSSPWP